MNKRFLITGGTGFIGSHLTKKLIPMVGEENVASVGSKQFDLRNYDVTRHLFVNHGQFDYIIHAADVQGDAQWSKENSADQFLANSAITTNVLSCWRDFQPQATFVTFSSLWAYPESIKDARESYYWDGSMKPELMHYGLIKKMLGVGITACKNQYGLKGTSLVLGTVYGPGDTTKHLIPTLLRKMQADPNQLLIKGSGTDIRDFVYIDDQIEGILWHLDFNGSLLNISSGTNYSVRDVVHTLVKLTGYCGEVVYEFDRTDNVNRYLNVTKAKEITGWPTYKLHTLEEGLKKTVEDFKKKSVDK